MSKKRRRAERRAATVFDDSELDEPDRRGGRRRPNGPRQERDRRRGRPAEPIAVQRSTPVQPAPAPPRRHRSDGDTGSLTPYAERAWDMLLAPAAATLTCGGCRNWQPHTEPGGRGTCDHPASGFSYPYEDTVACPFYEPRRR
ncbi:MAG TPA: hypothetical protein VFD32_14070 [Dehalococcoidia bacterium]|nr:hypothetical protein [Dehalococcoidia bacterium]